MHFPIRIALLIALLCFVAGPAAAWRPKRCRGPRLAKQACKLQRAKGKKRDKLLAKVMAAPPEKAVAALIRVVKTFDLEEGVGAKPTPDSIVSVYADALRKLGKPAFAAVTGLLLHKNEGIKIVGEKFLIYMAPDFVAETVALLQHSDRNTVRVALAAIPGAKAKAAPAIAPLIKMLDDRKKWRREGALGCLLRMGQHAKPAAARLLAEVQKTDRLQIGYLIRLLPKLGIPAKSFVATVFKLLRARKNDRSLPGQAGIALAQYGAPISSYLIKGMRDASEPVRYACLQAAGWLISKLKAQPPRSLAPSLRAILSSKNPYMAINASEYLAKLGDPKDVARVAKLLDHANPMVVREAIKALGMFKGAAASQKSRIQGYLTHKNSGIRFAAKRALANIK